MGTYRYTPVSKQVAFPTAKGTVASHTPDDVTIREENFGTRKKTRIAMLGAGISGVNFFKFAKEQLQNVEVVCHEKYHGVRGTWLATRYPGCACDIPRVVYQFPWRPAPWSQYYSHSPEIWQYIEMVEQKNNFDRVAWTDGESKWSLTVQNLEKNETFEGQVDFVVDGGRHLK
jgi:cation diffusion facilitator CzcD-associated flavoprotein CzcO